MKFKVFFFPFEKPDRLSHLANISFSLSHVDAMLELTVMVAISFQIHYFLNQI